MIVIGIAGPSCSGKTSIATSLAHALGASMLHLDKYHMKDYKRPIVNGQESFERPEQYNHIAMLEDYKKLPEQDYVILEGFLLFTYPELLNKCNYKFLIQLPYEIQQERRLKRSIEKDNIFTNGRSKNAEIGFLAHGHEEWLNFGEKQKDICDMILDGNIPVSDNVANILNFIGVPYVS